MKVSRRHFLGSSTATLASLKFVKARFGIEQKGEFKIGMCDWNLGPACDPEMIPKAREASLMGLQVSVGTAPDNIPLREPSTRSKYLEMGKRHGIVFHSVAAGGILNEIPLKSEPQSAVYVIDAIYAAAALGASNILIAFFGNGDLRLRDSTGEMKVVGSGPFKTYELDTVGVSRVIEALRQIAPYAEDNGIILGLENTLTADQNLEIMDQVGSKMLQVYYDVGNSTHYGYDVPSEIRMLGKDRICEIHLKDWEAKMLGSGGEVDFTAAAIACKDIGFDKWYVLETSGREGQFVVDTKTNVAFSKRLFG